MWQMLQTCYRLTWQCRRQIYLRQPLPKLEKRSMPHLPRLELFLKRNQLSLRKLVDDPCPFRKIKSKMNGHWSDCTAWVRSGGLSWASQRWNEYKHSLKDRPLSPRSFNLMRTAWFNFKEPIFDITSRDRSTQWPSSLWPSTFDLPSFGSDIWLKILKLRFV